MTMSSDEEGPSVPVQSTSKSVKPTNQKLTRKEQLAASKKNGKATKGVKPSKALKRKRVENSESEGDEDSNAMVGSEDEGMAKDFVFDGLGGGFVGEKRNQVWVS